MRKLVRFYLASFIYNVTFNRFKPRPMGILPQQETFPSLYADPSALPSHIKQMVIVVVFLTYSDLYAVYGGGEYKLERAVKCTLNWLSNDPFLRIESERKLSVLL